VSGSSLVQWLARSPVERQHGRELALLDHTADLAERQVENIGRVQTRAMFTTMQVNAMRREAERIAPDGAELYAMIAVAGAVEMTNVISRMSRSSQGRRF
jgi:hypothetical protein